MAYIPAFDRIGLSEKKKREASQAATAVAHALVDHLNTGVAQAYVNQKKLDTETKILQANVNQFAKQTTQWLKLVEDFNQALKEIGDLENWSRSIETDMRTISSALEYAYRMAYQTGRAQPPPLKRSRGMLKWDDEAFNLLQVKLTDKHLVRVEEKLTI